MPAALARAGGNLIEEGCASLTSNIQRTPLGKVAAVAKVLYTANAHVTGGRNGHGRTSDGELDVDLRVPTEMGGEGGGTNPEELFAVGWAACFESAITGVARRRHLEVGEVSIDSSISLLPVGDGSFKLAASLNVSIPAVDERAVAVELIRGAHEVCPYSNATRGNIDVELLLDGQAL